MPTLKMPSISADMRLDRKRPGTATSWSQFRTRMAEVISYNMHGQIGWLESNSKRLLFLCLGETEMLMTRNLFTTEYIPAVHPDHDFGTITKILDACKNIF